VTRRLSTSAIVALAIWALLIPAGFSTASLIDHVLIFVGLVAIIEGVMPSSSGFTWPAISHFFGSRPSAPEKPRFEESR
jgi:hypothetical protein